VPDFTQSVLAFYARIKFEFFPQFQKETSNLIKMIPKKALCTSILKRKPLLKMFHPKTTFTFSLESNQSTQKFIETLKQKSKKI
jgi:hypothetical protein